jgi:hypothetical protein
MRLLEMMRKLEVGMSMSIVQICQKVMSLGSLLIMMKRI